MKKIIAISLFALCLWGITAPVANAASWTGGFVKCGTGDDKNAAQDCDFADIINLVNTLIQYMIFIAMPLAAISFAYAGFVYLSAGGDTGKVKKAHDIFLSVGIGFVLVLSAWLIFKYIAINFLSDGYQNSTYLK